MIPAESGQPAEGTKRKSDFYSDGGPPDEEFEPYATDTPLTWVLGDDPKVLINAAMLSEWNRTLNHRDVARLTGLEDDIVANHLDDLNNHGVVKCVDGGDERRYELNGNNPTVRLLWELERTQLEHWHESGSD